jgi:hypothetical protein
MTKGIWRNPTFPNTQRDGIWTIQAKWDGTLEDPDTRGKCVRDLDSLVLADLRAIRRKKTRHPAATPPDQALHTHVWRNTRTPTRNGGVSKAHAIVSSPASKKIPLRRVRT